MSIKSKKNHFKKKHKTYTCLLYDDTEWYIIN